MVHILSIHYPRPERELIYLMASSDIRPLVAFAGLVVVSLCCGCEKPLDSPEYGEIIYQVPTELDRPIPLPELDDPSDSPLPGPEPSAAPDTSSDTAETSGNPPTAVETSSEPAK